MNRIILFLVVSLCCCGPWITADGQTPRPDPAEVLKQLLGARTPRPPGALEEPEPTRDRPESFFDKNKQPHDDAPIEDLIDYWERWADNSTIAPSETVARRLLEACVADPPLFGTFLELLPTNEAAALKIKEVYDRAQNNNDLDESVNEELKEWLIFNSTFFLDELLDLANKVQENDDYGSVENREALVSLANLNWELAEPLLRRLASSTPRSAALAQSLFYEHAIKEKDAVAEERYRNILKILAANRQQPGAARDIAIEALSTTEWSGRDEWYLSLFEDETLIDATDGHRTFTSLTTIFSSDPDKWIPIMARLVESKNLTVRSLAASCLISFELESARRDALLPLLPWLSNPTWVKDQFNERVRLIQSMFHADVPESVPGLIWIVENEAAGTYERSTGAQSLARYKDPRAVPALKKAVAAEKDEIHRQRMIEGLIACQGLTEDEQLKAVEAYAAKLTTPEGRTEVDGFGGREDLVLPVPVSIGKYLKGLTVTPDSLVHAVLTRAENLKSENLPLAKALFEIAHGWNGRQVDLDMITRIGNGSADAHTITQALNRGAKLRESLSSELHGLVAGSGTAQGIGVVLLDNASLAQTVLASEDQLAQIALLACSRLTNTALPVDLVAPLLGSKNSLLAQAAQKYLLVQDSEEARELLWKHHSNKAFITGWGEDVELYYGIFEPIKKMEEKLKAELFKEAGPVEIIALLAGTDQHNRVLRIFSDKAVYTHYEDRARYRERTITKAELASFKQFLTKEKLADGGPQFGYCHHSCTSEEFLTLTKAKGRRVYSEQSYEVWTNLRESFDVLENHDDVKLHYSLEKEIKGLEILYADKHFAVKDVWQRGNDIRVHAERVPSPEELNEQYMAAARGEVVQRSQEPRLSWRVFSNNKMGAVTFQPDGYSSFDTSKFVTINEDGAQRVFDDSQMQKLSADSIIVARNFDGLWKQIAGTKAVRVSGEGGAYSHPIATPDGKWVIVAKVDSGWSKPNYIVRFNSQTGREYRVNLEVADDFSPLTFLAPHGKVLLRRAKDPEGLYLKKGIGPDRPEYYLLDPATGETQLASGEFAPLCERGKRSLQPTGKPDEFWAAIGSGDKTQVGRYNIKDFTFKPLLAIPHIFFGSMSMWVDETQKKLYFVYNDQLLRLPLP